MKCERQFFVILGHYLPTVPPNNPKNQNFEKIKKKAWRYYHFHLRTTNDNHMMYGSWDMEHNTIICHSGPFFELFPH